MGLTSVITKDNNLLEQNSTQHNYFLDCYRILAILMVLSVHIRGYLKGTPDIINQAMGIGAYGVALYFILSGYFSYKSVTKEKSIRDYAKKKAIRILPMYYVSLIITFIVGVFITDQYPLDLKWLYHTVFLNMFIPSQEWSWWNSVNFFWTMPAFVAWYILSPLLFKYINNSKKMAIVTLVASISAPFLKKLMYGFASEQFVNWNFFCLLYVFLFGSLAYFFVKEHKQFTGILCSLSIFAIGVIVGNRSGFFVFGIGFFLLMLLASVIPLRWENEKLKDIVKWLSAVTYSVYLTHWFILQLFGEELSALPWLIGYLVFIIIAWIIGGLAYKFIEIPVYRILKRTRFMKREP